MASCIDAKTGKYLWNERAGPKQSSSPVAVGRLIYSVSEGRHHIPFRSGPEIQTRGRE